MPENFEDVQSMHKPTLFSSKLTGLTKLNANLFLDKIQCQLILG